MTGVIIQCALHTIENLINKSVLRQCECYFETRTSVQHDLLTMQNNNRTTFKIQRLAQYCIECNVKCQITASSVDCTMSVSTSGENL